ncbi:hypothetical protein ACQEVB_20455 [Pseudonocardia sp. CA-107938]|uniref:hypothetical protein n=1 Tax=Pseudonocardia sp. CA-107938 TaxID=3240021 RepID=UPI003D94FC8A
MDIVDATGAEVRVAVATLARRGTPLRFTLVPMLHVGPPEFFAAVSDLLRRHDLVVAEGVRGGRAVTTLTSAYAGAAGNPRLGFVVQPQEMVEVGRPVIRPDMDGAEFDRHWNAVDLGERLITSVGAPAVGWWMRTFATRAQIARQMALDDGVLVDVDADESQVRALFGDRRDALLAAALTAIHDERSTEQITVAVVYGAMHVRPAVTALRRLGYVVRHAEWLRVFTF